MTKKYETIVFTEESFGDKLWQKVGEQLKLLLTAEYVCVIREEEYGIIVIQFQHDKPEWGEPAPIWLTPEEEATVVYEGSEIDE